MDKSNRKKTIILKWFFIVVFLWLVVDKFVSIVEVGIGGDGLDSPNGRYAAGYQSLATGGLFASVGLSDIKRFYRFEIYDVNDIPKESSFRYTDENRVKCVDLDVLHRDLNIESENIEWSPDSSEVTFAFKDMEFKLMIDEPKDEQKQ